MSTPPRCPTHGRELICPACVGARGGAQVTPARLRAVRKAQRARKAAAKARRET